VVRSFLSMVRGFSDASPDGQIHRVVAHCLWNSGSAFRYPIPDAWNQQIGFQGQRSRIATPIDCFPGRCGIVAASALPHVAPKVGRMIQPLRGLHYRVILGAVVLLPTVFLFGLSARRPFPPEEIQLPRQAEWPGEFSGYLKSFRQTLTPDALVFWSPVNSSDQPLLPEARLLGDLQGCFVPKSSLPSDGYVLLYSLAHQKVIAALPIGGKEKLP
jgi:hypothetical protein